MTPARALAVLLLAAAPLASAQEPAGPLEQRPFVAGPRFPAGEQWTTCGGLRLRAAEVDGEPAEASIAWTQSVLVVDRPDGFALRALVTSVAQESRRGGVRALRSWDEAAPGAWADPEPRTYTWTFLPAWDLARVTGPSPALRELLGRLLAGDDPGPEGALRALLGRRGEELAAGALLDAADVLGQPMHEVMASLERGPILPGQTWGLAARGGAGPAGVVRYAGADWACAHFEATWDVGPGRTLGARFAIDGARRPTWLGVQEARLAGATRTVEELAFVLVRVHDLEEAPWELDPFGR